MSLKREPLSHADALSLIRQLEQEYICYNERTMFTKDYIVIRKDPAVSPEAISKFIKALWEIHGKNS